MILPLLCNNSLLINNMENLNIFCEASKNKTYVLSQIYLHTFFP